jgi:hypothetical protein
LLSLSGSYLLSGAFAYSVLYGLVGEHMKLIGYDVGGKDQEKLFIGEYNRRTKKVKILFLGNIREDIPEKVLKRAHITLSGKE